eukprot:s4570_g7.t1
MEGIDRRDPACVRTRSRGDTRSHGANREVRLPIVQVDFYFASLEEGGERPSPEQEQENCVLTGVDLDTKMVLAVPGPNKGVAILAKATEEIVRFTLGSRSPTPSLRSRLLYAAIQYLSGKASAPAERAMKQLRHLIGYLWESRQPQALAGRSVMQLTGDQKPGEDAHSGGALDRRLLRQHTRKSRAYRIYRRAKSSLAKLSPVYSFVRGQKVVTLSSGEAQLVALMQTTSESILVKKAWEFLVRQEAVLVMRSDSSVARAIASSARCGTRPPSARGRTKCFTAKRLRLLCYLVRLVQDNGDQLVQLLAATTLQICEFGPGGPDDLFEDLVAVVYMMVVFFVRYLWRWLGVLMVWWLSRGAPITSQEASYRNSSESPAGDTKEHEDPDSDNQEEETCEGITGTAVYEFPDELQRRGDPGNHRGARSGPSGGAEDHDWMEENVLPMLGVTPPTAAGLESATPTAGRAATTSAEARPTGATSSRMETYTPALAPSSSTSTRASRKIDQGRERGNSLRWAQTFLPEEDLTEMVWISSYDYAYHKEGCGDLACARKISRVSVRRALQAGKAACKHCPGPLGDK